jgi:hypothetical protein
VIDFTATVRQPGPGQPVSPRADRGVARQITSAAVQPGTPAGGPHSCPRSKSLRERLRAMAADLVAGWKAGGVPAEVKSSAGLRKVAETLVRRAGAAPEHVGWTMVTIVSEHWRGRLATGGNGRRLLLLPDCPQAVGSRERSGATAAGLPQVCGPACGILTIWSAARDTGWVVESTNRAMAAIGGLLTGQYDGILGVARLADLEKAFGMLPAFSLPVAAVPFDELVAGGRACACSRAAGVGCVLRPADGAERGDSRCGAAGGS